MNVIAQIFGFIALIVYCISIQASKRENLLKALVICNIFYSLQYLMLNAYSALFVGIIAVVRSIVFVKYEISNKRVDLWVLLLLLAITVYSGILSYDGPISLIPIITGIMYTTAVWQPNLKIFRINVLINSSSWIFYNYNVGAYVSIIACIIELVFGIIAVIRLDILKKKEKTSDKDKTVKFF